MEYKPAVALERLDSTPRPHSSTLAWVLPHAVEEMEVLAFHNQDIFGLGLSSLEA